MSMPTHIVAVGGFVENDEGEILLVNTQHRGWDFPGGQVEIGENVLDMVTAPAARVRYQAYLDFAGQVRCMEYVVRPTFELKLDKTV